MPIRSRFDHGSTLERLWLGPEHGFFLLDMDGYAFQRREAKPEYNAVIAIYASHVEGEEAVQALQNAGSDMRTLSIVARDPHTDEHVVSYYNHGDRMKYWGKTGAYWGGFWGLLIGSAVFAVPGVGPVLAAGPVIAWIVGALEGAVLIGGLSALKADNFLLMVHGETKKVENARDTLGNTKLLSMNIHAANAPETVAS